MAPITHLLFAAVLLSILAAGAASAGTTCVPGLAIPHGPLESCRVYVVSRACSIGPYLPMPVMKERCCRELEEVAAYCRCEALRILMDGVIAPWGRHEGRLEDLPGCPRQAQRAFAATLVTEPECNLPTIHGGPYCLSLGDGEYGGEARTMPSM
ncbi:hypothetical protein EJB05_13424, partial [Eragrostis curvula]